MELTLGGQALSPESPLPKRMDLPSSRAGFVNLGPLDIWGRITLCCRQCPLHCRMSGSIPAPLDASSSSPPPLSPHSHIPNGPWEAKSILVENHRSKVKLSGSGIGAMFTSVTGS